MFRSADPVAEWPSADFAPISEELIRPGQTPFTRARLNHRWAAYIGTRERAVMAEQSRDAALEDELVQQTPNLRALIVRLHDGPVSGRHFDAWDLALEQLTNEAVTASPYMEYILALLGLGVGYAPCQFGRPLSEIVLGPQARRDNDPASPHRPCEWLVSPADKQLEEILADARQRIREDQERSRQRREQRAAARQRLSREFRQIQQTIEEIDNDPVRLAAYLRAQGEAVPDELPPLAELQRLLRAREEVERRDTYAPLPTDGPRAPQFD
jgi:hypothetical protein